MTNTQKALAFAFGCILGAFIVHGLWDYVNDPAKNQAISLSVASVSLAICAALGRYSRGKR